jgi:hypothetical protein
MGAEQTWVQPDAGNPLSHKPSVMPRGHTALLPASGCEQELARFLACRPNVVVDRLAGLFRQFKADGPAGRVYGRARNPGGSCSLT